MDGDHENMGQIEYGKDCVMFTDREVWRKLFRSVVASRIDDDSLKYQLNGIMLSAIGPTDADEVEGSSPSLTTGQRTNQLTFWGR